MTVTSAVVSCTCVSIRTYSSVTRPLATNETIDVRLLASETNKWGHCSYNMIRQLGIRSRSIAVDILCSDLISITFSHLVSGHLHSKYYLQL